MKKLFCLLIMALLLGCGGGGGGGSSSTSPTTPASNDPPSTPAANDPPTPPPPQPRIVLVGSILMGEDVLGDAVLFGEVKNTGNAVATFVQAKCDLYDSQSMLIGQGSGYIEGSVVHLTLGNTNTGLSPYEKGVFRVTTTTKKNLVTSYNCSYTYDVFQVSDPLAGLQVVGTVNLYPNSSNKAQFSGQVKNIGTKGLINGQVIIVSRDANGGIIGINSGDVNGETVLINNRGGTNDNALTVNSQGTFIVSTSVPFSSVNNYEIKYNWEDFDALPNPSNLPTIEPFGSLLARENILGNIEIFGEVQNTGNAVATSLKAKCEFYNTQSILIGQANSYIEGSVVNMFSENSHTNYALKPSEKGVFVISPDIKRNTVASYKCSFTYEMPQTTDPVAKLEVIGPINFRPDIFNEAEFLGQVKNTGTKGLTFGRVIFVTRDSNGLILGIDSNYIDGETVTLNIGNTDTALNVNVQGTFWVRTTVLFNNVASYEIKYDWHDSDILDGVATEINSALDKKLLEKNEKFVQRNQAIEKLRLERSEQSGF